MPDQPHPLGCEQVVWEGYVRISVAGKTTMIAYKKNGEQLEQTYIPDGFMEKKAVSGLVDRLK